MLPMVGKITWITTILLIIQSYYNPIGFGSSVSLNWAFSPSGSIVRIRYLELGWIFQNPLNQSRYAKSCRILFLVIPNRTRHINVKPLNLVIHELQNRWVCFSLSSLLSSLSFESEGEKKEIKGVCKLLDLLIGWSPPLLGVPLKDSYIRRILTPHSVA